MSGEMARLTASQSSMVNVPSERSAMTCRVDAVRRTRTKRKPISSRTGSMSRATTAAAPVSRAILRPMVTFKLSACNNRPSRQKKRAPQDPLSTASQPYDQELCENELGADIRLRRRPCKGVSKRIANSGGGALPKLFTIRYSLFAHLLKFETDRLQPLGQGLGLIAGGRGAGHRPA